MPVTRGMTAPTVPGPSVLIVTAKWWASSARLSLALLDHGCRVSVLCPAHHPLRRLSRLEEIRTYRGVRSLRSLQCALRDIRPDLVIPCDDGVVAQLHSLHALDPTLRSLIEKSLGDPGGYAITSSRREFMRTAAALGLQVPHTERILAAGDIEAWRHPAAGSGVLKVNGETGGNGVRICASLEQARAALLEFRVEVRWIAAVKRMIIDRDPLALWMRKARLTREISMQRFIDGRPANAMFACLEGKVLGVLSVEVLLADGPTGAALVVRRVRDERMAHCAQVLAEHLGLSGFYGLDFIIEAGTGKPYLIEMNPRCTQIGHLAFTDLASLAASFSAALGSSPARAGPEARLLAPVDRLALYPTALRVADEHRHLVDSSVLDAPAGEPLLTDELARPIWPQRQWIARLYHRLRPIRHSHSTTFAVSGSGEPG